MYTSIYQIIHFAEHHWDKILASVLVMQVFWFTIYFQKCADALLPDRTSWIIRSASSTFSQNLLKFDFGHSISYHTWRRLGLLPERSHEDSRFQSLCQQMSPWLLPLIELNLILIGIPLCCPQVVVLTRCVSSRIPDHPDPLHDIPYCVQCCTPPGWSSPVLFSCCPDIVCGRPCRRSYVRHIPVECNPR